MNMNAHFCWGLAMWGSADLAREHHSYLVSCFGYYYSVFYAGFALMNTDHTFHLESMKRTKNKKVENWLDDRLPFTMSDDFKLLRAFREVTSYLGMEDPASKLRVVRGHPFGFDFGTERVDFFDAVERAKNASRNLITYILSEIESFCIKNGWRGPKKGDDDWLDEYLQGDVLLRVIPRGEKGALIYKKAFSLLEANA